MQEFKDRLKALRNEKKLTQAKLAAMLNYGSTAIANYESGRNQPAIADLKKIAHIFDVSLDYLLGVTDIRKSFTPEEDSIQKNEFFRYYSLLSEHSKEEAFMYMQWLLERDEKRKHSEEGTTVLRAAQTQKEYRKD